ncbi:MAG: GLPGLI family protein [Bacteroidia bacterium]|nr:GLPGLI family protein [Bacteroidia bacterium]NNK71554.1 GLPGLI family protein [Flavobacteriaceae bacterium]
MILSRVSLVLFVILMSLTISAQEFHWRAYYISKTTIDFESWGKKQLTTEQKKELSVNMSHLYEKVFILDFDRKMSLFKEDERLETSGQKAGWDNLMSGQYSSGPIYKNVQAKRLVERREFYGKLFLIDDSLPEFKWQLTDETKKIGDYTCFKAICIRSLSEIPPKGLNVRPEQDNSDTDDQVIITAWYTPQIPANHGPGHYWGLPGLILELNEDKTTILCSKIILHSEEKIAKTKIPSKGKRLTLDEFDVIFDKKKDEIKKMKGRIKGKRTKG